MFSHGSLNFVIRFAAPGSELSNLCLINGIINKITGPDERNINSNGVPDSWLGIGNSLIINFSNQRNETAG